MSTFTNFELRASVPSLTTSQRESWCHRYFSLFRAEECGEERSTKQLLDELRDKIMGFPALKRLFHSLINIRIVVISPEDTTDNRFKDKKVESGNGS